MAKNKKTVATRKNKTKRISRLSESTISKLQPEQIIETIELNANLQIQHGFLAPIHDGKVLRSETIPVNENNTFNILITTTNKKLKFHHNNMKPKILKKVTLPKKQEIEKYQISIETEWKNCCRAAKNIERGKILWN